MKVTETASVLPPDPLDHQGGTSIPT